MIRAFQAVAAAGKKTGKDAGGALNLLNGAFGKLAALLPAVSFAAAAVGMSALVKGAVDSADSIGKLSQKTGLGAEALSTLKFAAETADLSFEGLSGQLVRFNRSMADLDGGSRDVAEGVRQLFGSAKALDGLNTDGRFRKVSDALGRLESGYEKTRLAQVFFGRSGADLIPLLNDLANGGFERARIQAEKFGLIIDQKTAAAAQRANDAVKLLSLQVKGAAAVFASGFAPGFADTLEAVGDVASEEKRDGFKRLGEAASDAFRTIVAGAFSMFQGLKFIDDALGRLKYLAFKVGGLAMTGSPFSFLTAEEIVSPPKSITELLDALGQRTADFEKKWNDLMTRRPATKPGTVSTAAAPTLDPAATKAREDQIRTSHEAEFALNRAFVAQMEQSNQALFDQGKKSLEAYHEERLRITRAANNDEIAAMQQKEADINASSAVTNAEKIKRERDAEAVREEIRRKRVEHATAEAALDAQRAQATRELAQARIDVERQLFELQGKSFAAAEKSINAQAEALTQKFPNLTALIDQLRTAQLQAARFDESSRAANQSIRELGDKQADLQRRVAIGDLFPFEAVKLYRREVEASLPTMERQLADLQALTQPTDAQKEKLRELTVQIEDFRLSADGSGQQMAQFKAQVESGFQGAFQSFLTDLPQAKNGLDALRSLALGLAGALQQAAAQLLATAAAQKLLSLFTGGKSGANGVEDAGKKGLAQATPLIVASGAMGVAGEKLNTAGLTIGGAAIALGIAADKAMRAAFAMAAANSVTVGFARGGFVSGPGTGTSDSIPARLSAGEFVVRAAAVRQPGVLPMLTSINRGWEPVRLRTPGEVARFAEGGLVTGGSGAAGGVTRDHLVVDVSDDLIVRQIESGPGSRAQIRSLAKNRAAARRALGIDR